MCLYNPKNSVNELKIVRTTEPQQIDKNTNGRNENALLLLLLLGGKALAMCVCVCGCILLIARQEKTKQAGIKTARVRKYIHFCTLDISQ